MPINDTTGEFDPDIRRTDGFSGIGTDRAFLFQLASGGN
jgi:hypothetical protein